MKNRLKIKYIGHKRNNWIIDNCCGKHVVHVGCTDMLMRDNHISRNKFLHTQLMSSSASILGLDIDIDGLEYMRTTMGITDIAYGDAEKLAEFIDRPFDVIVACDVIEHLNNTGNFFSSARQCLEKNGGGKILLSFPNALSLKNNLAALVFRKEINHPDHVAWFSPMCIEQICKRWNLQIHDWVGYTWNSPSLSTRFANLVAAGVIRLFRNGYLSQGLGCILTLPDADEGKA